MDAFLADRVERDVMRADEPAWLRLWARQGWVASGSPIVCPSSRDGDPVHRYELVRMSSAEWAPSIPWIEPDVERTLMRRSHEAGSARLVEGSGGARHGWRTQPALAWLSRRRGRHEATFAA